MKILWIALALVCAVSCGVLGYLLAKRKPVLVPIHNSSPRLTTEDLEEDIEAYRRVDPKLIISKEEGRLKTGLQELKGLAVGPDDRVYVVGDKNYVVLGMDGKTESRVDLGQSPTCIAVGPDSVVYVGLRDHVEVYDGKGARQAVWTAPGPLAWITSIAVSDKEVYVADFGDKTVFRCEKSGKVLGQLGEVGAKPGTGKYEIPSPYFDVSVDSSGTPWVAHTGRRLIESYKPDGSLATSWGKSGPQIDRFSGCCNPSYFAIRKDGSFVTSEKGLVRVKVHAANGDLVGVIAAPKDFEKGLHGLDLAVDSKDRVLVLDPGTATVRIYSLKRGESHP
jgi:hypothetical protein